MTCDQCDFGWRPVQDPYVLHLAPDPTAEVLAHLALADTGPALVAALHAEVAAHRAALRNSVYPCKACRPGPFFRWAGGHHASDHDTAGCAECIEVQGRPRRPRTMAAARGNRAPAHTDDDRREF